MPKFTVNADRYDPYKNFKFRVFFDTRAVAGVTKMTALKRTSEVIEFREGGDASNVRKLPGRVKHEPITLERGVTHDVEFEQWANKVWDYANAQAAPDQRTLEVSLRDFRKNIRIELYNEAGQKVLSYKVYRCWVSEYQAMADLDSNANAVLIQMLKLENEGWERDLDVAEPAEPSFLDPAP
jgi:phage tail-like protein